MQYLEVTPTDVVPVAGTAPGVYLFGADLWFVPVAGAYPMCACNMASLLKGDPPKPQRDNSISASDLLKAIAISQRPELATALLT